MKSTHIYKIMLPKEWAAFQESRLYTGAPIDLQDGYIHFSTAQQAEETAAKHFKASDEIVLAEVPTELLSDALKWEVSRGGALFPHLYADLRLDAVTRHWLLKRDAGGAYVFPDDI